MKYTFTTAIHKEGKWYVAHCVELGVASQGKTVAEARKNIKEAVELGAGVSAFVPKIVEKRLIEKLRAGARRRR